jgi:hypothetical protein
MKKLLLILLASSLATVFAAGPTPLQNAQISGMSAITGGTFSIQSGVVWSALSGSTIHLDAAAVYVGTLTSVSNGNIVLDPNGTGANELLANTYVGPSSVTPTALLHLGAGVATAGGAPFKLTAGVLLTAPEPGTLNYDGSFYYATNSTPATSRQRVSTDTAPVAIAASAIDWSLGSTFTKTLAANTSFTFANAVDGRTIVVALTNTASNYTVSWSGGVAPTQTTGAKTDVYTFVKVGSAIYGSVVQNF